MFSVDSILLNHSSLIIKVRIKSGIPHFIGLCFIVLHGYCVFYKLKARSFISKRFQIATLQWSGSDWAISPRGAYDSDRESLHLEKLKVEKQIKIMRRVRKGKENNELKFS